VSGRCGLWGLWGSLVALTLALVGCGDDDTYVLASVYTTAGEMSGILQLEVAVRRSDKGSSTLLYPKNATAPTLVIRDKRALTFSVSFPSEMSGMVELGVIPLSSSGAAQGFGKTVVSLRAGEVTKADVRIDPSARPPADWPRRHGRRGRGPWRPCSQHDDGSQRSKPVRPKRCQLQWNRALRVCVCDVDDGGGYVHRSRGQAAGRSL
jgi:hypothetical protein